MGATAHDTTAARKESFDAHREAAPAVVVVILLQLTLASVSRAEHWSLWIIPWWAWLVCVVPEIVLLVPLLDDGLRTRLERTGRQRAATFALFGVVTLTNALLLVAVLASLVEGHERSGGQLLLKALTLWATNTITFGLWFWSFDRGGPAHRQEPSPRPPDFLFPQLSDPQLAAAGWQPRFFDYLYIAFTNSIAFSPTDTLPLTGTAKRLMLAESTISAVTVLLVAARSVNIFR